MGNMFVRRAGTAHYATPAMSGSHSDTQPTGGRFDGISGVLAAFEALEAIDDAGIATRRPLEAAIWTNEEGARFPPGVMGSWVDVGQSAQNGRESWRERKCSSEKYTVGGVTVK